MSDAVHGIVRLLMLGPAMRSGTGSWSAIRRARATPVAIMACNWDSNTVLTEPCQIFAKHTRVPPARRASAIAR